MDKVSERDRFKVTIAQGLRNQRPVEPTGFPSVEAFVAFLDEEQEGLEVEGWWSPHLYDGDRRGENWVASWGVAVDIDGPLKKECQPMPDLDVWQDRWEAGEIPGTIAHPTLSGMRVIFLFVLPVKDGEVWKRCAKAAGALVEQAMKAHALTGEIDPHVVNLGNLNWLPNTTDERGRYREAECFKRLGDLQNPRRLLAAAPKEESLFATSKSSGAKDPTRVEIPKPTARDRRVALEGLLRLGLPHASDRGTWLKVGMVLHWAFDGASAGLDAWDAWSKQAPNYGGTIKAWNHFTPRPDGVRLGWLVTLVRNVGQIGAWEGGEEILEQMGLRQPRTRSLLREESAPDQGATFRLDVDELRGTVPAGGARVVVDLEYLAPARFRDWFLF